MNIRPQAGTIRHRFCRRLLVCAAVAGICWPFEVPASTAVSNPSFEDGTHFAGSSGFVPAAPTDAPAAAPIESGAILPASTRASDLTNPLVPMSSAIPQPTVGSSLSNSIPETAAKFLADTNGLPPAMMSKQELRLHLSRQLEMARYLRRTRQPKQAEGLLIRLLADSSPKSIQQAALLELAAAVQDEDDLPRAQQIYSQFLTKWPDDPRVPEILLRQGVLFRQMGLSNLALTKFYAVMTSALVLKSDQMDYYARLVLQAQIEIAETNYKLGKYKDAATFFTRLLKQDHPDINRSQILYKLTRCESELRQYADVVTDAKEYLSQFPHGPEQPEIRFHLALALKKLGRNNESLQQVLLLLKEERTRTKDQPAVWAYWQQRAGNLIANQLYREGDYAQALQIYHNLAQVDSSLQWRLPVDYQIGLIYERLWQPQKATDTYKQILSHEKALGTNVPPSLKTVFDMARWRIHFIQWQAKAEAVNQKLHDANAAGKTTSASTSLAGSQTTATASAP